MGRSSELHQALAKIILSTLSDILYACAIASLVELLLHSGNSTKPSTAVGKVRRKPNSFWPLFPASTVAGISI